MNFTEFAIIALCTLLETALNEFYFKLNACNLFLRENLLIFYFSKKNAINSWRTFDALLAHFWRTFGALLTHFWCTFKKCIKSASKGGKSASKVHHFWKCIKSASKVHQKCTKSASKAHQKCIKSASKVHQKCTKSASTVHQKCSKSASKVHQKHQKCIAFLTVCKHFSEKTFDTCEKNIHMELKVE